MFVDYHPGNFVAITLSCDWSRGCGTISIDSEMITVAKYPANMMISYDILVSGVIDRYSCHYSSQYLVSVFDSKINLFEFHSTRQTMMSSQLQLLF